MMLCNRDNLIRPHVAYTIDARRCDYPESNELVQIMRLSVYVVLKNQ